MYAHSRLRVSYLLLCYIYWLVENNPDCRLPATGMSCRALIRHVMFCIRKQTSQGQMSDRSVGTCKVGDRVSPARESAAAKNDLPLYRTLLNVLVMIRNSGLGVSPIWNQRCSRLVSLRLPSCKRNPRRSSPPDHRSRHLPKDAEWLSLLFRDVLIRRNCGRLYVPGIRRQGLCHRGARVSEEIQNCFAEAVHARLKNTNSENAKFFHFPL